MSGSPVPLIDIGPFSTDVAGRRRVASQVDQACRELGFLMIENHGLDIGMIEACWLSVGRFFASSIDNRLSARATDPGHPYGYHRFGAEALAYSLDQATPPDLKETFNVGPLESPGRQLDEQARSFAFARNLWPREPAGFRRALETYYRELRRLSDHVMEIFAAALGLPLGHFATAFSQPISALRAINYPPLDTAPAPGQLRAGAHTDYGTLTLLLLQPGIPGLQVRSGGAWHDVVAPHGALVVNIGDLMARWTNDRWVSTLHRVVNPDTASSATARQSLVFFHTPNWDTEIACLPTCVDGDTPARYTPVLAGPHLAGKFAKTVHPAAVDAP